MYSKFVNNVNALTIIALFAYKEIFLVPEIIPNLKATFFLSKGIQRKKE